MIKFSPFLCLAMDGFFYATMATILFLIYFAYAYYDGPRT